jgi:hypothetical protein
MYDPAAAREELKQGYALREAGRCAEALRYLRESLRLDPQVRTLLNLADCEERVGQLVDAEAHWVRARDMAETDPAMRQEAADRLDALERRMPRLTILLPTNAPPEVTISRDGVTLLAPSLGVALPTDPGTHVIEVAAPGRRANRVEVTLAEGEDTTVSAAPGEAEPGLAPAAASSDGAPAALLPPAAPKRGGTIVATLGWGLGAASVLSFGLGAVEGVTAEQRHDDAVTACHGACSRSPDAQRLQRDAESAATLSTIGLATGGVLAGTSVALLLLRWTQGDAGARAPKTSAVRWRWAPMAGGQRLGVVTEGAW